MNIGNFIGIGFGGGFGGASFTPASEASMFAWWSADDPSMETETINEAFSPSAVNTGAGTIALTTTGFTRVANYFFGVFYFSTTGTLPSPFVANTPYIGVNDGSGNYSFYKYNPTAADLPRWSSDESVFPGYLYAFQRGRINITTQGAGTHTISTDPLITTIKNKKDNTDLFRTTTRAEKFRLLNDANGPYIYHAGPLALASSGAEPEGPIMQDAITAAKLGDFFENKRYAWSVYAMEAMPAVYFATGRAVLAPSRVVAATGIFTALAHGLVDGEEVWTDVLSDGGAFPTPTVSFGANLYVARRSADTLSLHPTQADALARTNTYVYSNTGTGIFQVTGGRGVRSTAGSRRIMFDLNMQSNDHAFSNSTYDGYDTVVLSSSTVFMSSGFGNGNLNFFQTNGAVGSNWTVLKIHFYIPPNSVGPICLDTGTPLTSGTYWMTQEVGQTWRRIHRTEADAIASVGVLTNSIPNTQVIKYGTLGSGNGRVVCLERFTWKGFDDGMTSTGATLGNYNTGSIFVGITDYNDGGGKHRYIMGQGARNNLMNNLVSSRNSPMPAKSIFSGLILNNAGQPHVPGHYKVREVMMGATDSDPTTIVNNMANYLSAKWGYSYTP